ncbi:MAG: serine/threonine protein kinase [Deltaproteobacteria bacterium]|nr:serine/threonine protein kinase [Deltaproteobacteria bacterium]
MAAQSEAAQLPPDDDEGSTDHDERVGLLVADRYRIAKVLGVGGMGGVYEAEHLLIGKKVALKCLHREYARDRDIVERFKREARAATLIGNDHIIDVTDMGDLPDGSPFLVMEYLAGRPLAALCEHGPLPVRRAVHIARQIGNALGAAHDKGIVHRDLKPENVFLIERNGDPDFVKVLDFGISKMHSSGVDRGLTRTGMAMGTPSYMSPEQAQGSKNLDHRTDVWALGVILYEMLAARRPFDADSYPLLLMNIVATDPDPVSSYRKDLPEPLADLVMRCLVKDQEGRIGTMRELVDALAPYEELEVEIELSSPSIDVGDRVQTATDRYKATALSRKKQAAATEPENVLEERRSGNTQPDGSLEAPPPVSLAQAEAEARAKKGERDAASKEAIGSQPRLEKDSQRAPALTAPEVRALEQKARGGNTTTLLVAGVAVIAVAAIGFAAMSGSIGGAATPPPTTTATPPTTGVQPPDPPPTTSATPPPTTSTPAPPAEVRIRIRVEPADARILIGGVEFPNPMDAPQPRSLTPTRITIERDGHTTIEQLAIFGEDQSFMFQMARGRGVEQRGLGSSSGGGSGAGSAMEATTETMGGAMVYEGMQGGFRDEF